MKPSSITSNANKNESLSNQQQPRHYTKKSISRLVIIFLLMLLFGIALLFDTIFSSLDLFLPDNKNFNNNRANSKNQFGNDDDISLQQQHGKALSSEDLISPSSDDHKHFSFADTYLKRWYLEDQVKQLFGTNDNDNNDNGNQEQHHQFENNINFRLVPNVLVENNDRTEIPFSPLNGEPISFEKCRDLCISAGTKKCTYFSRTVEATSTSRFFYSNYHMSLLHQQLMTPNNRRRARLPTRKFFEQERCWKQKKARLHRQQKSQEEEQHGIIINSLLLDLSALKSIPKKCTFHFGFPNLVPPIDHHLKKQQHHSKINEVWFPEEVKEKTKEENHQSLLSRRQKRKSSSKSNLVAFALQVSSSIKGVELALGALKTYLKDEEHVAVFFDRTEVSHVGIIGYLLDQKQKTQQQKQQQNSSTDNQDNNDTTNDQRFSSPSSSFNDCVKISEMMTLFGDLMDGADVENARRDFVSPSNQIDARAAVSDFEHHHNLHHHVNNQQPSLEKIFKQLRRASTSSSATAKKNNIKSNKSNIITVDVDDEASRFGPILHNRPGVPLSVPIQFYFGPPSMTAGDRAKRTILKSSSTTAASDDNDDDKCFHQGFITSRSSFDLSKPIPNLFSSSSSSASSSCSSSYHQQKEGCHDSRSRGHHLLRFLNPVSHPFLSYGIEPNTGSWLSLRALHETALFFPNSSWYFLLDDETFVIIKSFRYFLRLASLSGQHRLSRNYYGFQMTVNPLAAHRHWFVSSKSGMLIPQVVMKELLLGIGAKSSSSSSSSSSRISMCLSVCRQNYIDERIACCMHGLDVGEAHVNSFFPLRLERSFPDVNFSVVTSFGGMQRFEDFIIEEEAGDRGRGGVEKIEATATVKITGAKNNENNNDDDDEAQDARAAINFLATNEETSSTRASVVESTNHHHENEKRKSFRQFDSSHLHDLVFSDEILRNRKFGCG